jgi:hypothetical protein
LNGETHPYRISVWGNDGSDGVSLSVNKYDFPPPIDNQIAFGSMVIVKEITGLDDDKITPCSINVAEWNMLYEQLFGGFDDIGSEDESSEDEIYTLDRYTKDGYLKDGFIVDSDEDEDECADVATLVTTDKMDRKVIPLCDCEVLFDSDASDEEDSDEENSDEEIDEMFARIVALNIKGGKIV